MHPWAKSKPQDAARRKAKTTTCCAFSSPFHPLTNSRELPFVEVGEALGFGFVHDFGRVLRWALRTR
jgi:hypothetical protein